MPLDTETFAPFIPTQLKMQEELGEALGQRFLPELPLGCLLFAACLGPEFSRELL